MTAAALPNLPSRPANWPRATLRRPVLAECVVLALLLHALMVLVFGSAPGGSAQPGEGVYGSLNIRLSGSGPPGPEVAAAPAPPAAYTGPSGSAEERRWGGTVRDRPAPVAPDSEPGAVRQGTWNPLPTPQAADPLPPTAESLPALQPAVPALPELPPLPSPSSPVAPVTPAVPLPELAPMPAPTRSLPGAAPPPVPVPMERPLNRVAPLDSPALPPPDLPALAPLPAALRSLPATAPQALPVDRPALNRIQPVAPVAPVAPVEPLNLPAAQAPGPAPEARSAAAESSSSTAATATPPALPTPGTGAAAPGSTPRATGGAPDAGAVLGHDVATAPSSPASAPRLNLDLVRPRGGEISRQGSRGLVNMLPHPPDNKLATDIEKSTKPDCRTAYSGMGLLAAVPLAVDAVRKDGCRW